MLSVVAARVKFPVSTTLTKTRIADSWSMEFSLRRDYP